MGERRAVSAEEIDIFFAERGASRPCGQYLADLLAVYGMHGDDAAEALDAFFERFDVDRRDYRWQFHHAPEGMFHADLKGAEPISLTAELLARIATEGRWPAMYPEGADGAVRTIDTASFLGTICLFGLAAIGLGTLTAYLFRCG